MSAFTGLVLRGGRFGMQKMCGFRNIQIRVDEALMFNATLYIYNPTCYEFKIHFRSSSLSLVFFSLSPFSLVSGFSFFFGCWFFCHGFWNSNIRVAVYIS